MRRTSAFAVLLLGCTPALAQEPVGCDKFKFPVEREKAALAGPSLPKIESGAQAPMSAAVIVGLRPLADAQMPKPPERSQKPETFAGFVNLGPVAAGTYTITVSDYAWVDVLQNGNYLKPKEFSGVKGCDGIRKVMKFDLPAGSASIQLSGVGENAIKLAVFRVTE
jgi:hypothetical protein